MIKRKTIKKNNKKKMNEQENEKNIIFYVPLEYDNKTLMLIEM